MITFGLTECCELRGFRAFEYNAFIPGEKKGENSKQCYHLDVTIVIPHKGKREPNKSEEMAAF